MAESRDPVAGLDQDIQTRLRFLGFTPADAQLLQSLRPWAEQILPAFVKEFFDRAFRDPQFVATVSQGGGSREQLEASQRAYILDFFSGMPGGAYAASRREIGRKYSQLKTSPRARLGSYRLYCKVLLPAARRKLRFRPRKANQAAEALHKLLLIDMSLVMDAYNEALTGQVRSLAQRMAESSAAVSKASQHLAVAAEEAGRATSGIVNTIQEFAHGAHEQSFDISTTTDAMAHLTKAIQQIARGSEEQAGAIERTMAVVSQVSKSSAGVAKSAHLVAESARKAHEAAQNGVSAVQQAAEGMHRVKDTVETVSRTISGLGQQSAEIGKIVSTIDDIAAQTNLLALNAAIEAARAGDQGRGFAVVADEVRALAVRVAQATKEIAKLIEGIQKTVDESIKAVEQGSGEVAERVQMAQSSGQALTSIIESVKTVAVQIEQISAAVGETAARADQMVKGVESVSTVIQQNTAAAEEMSASSSSVAKSLQTVAAVAQQSSSGAHEASSRATQIASRVQEVVASSQSLAELAKDLERAAAAFRIGEDQER